MKHRIHFANALALVAALAGCGGGGADKPDTVLPIDDGQPEAYSATYLAEHPEMLVQPEHLIIAPLDPKGRSRGETSVRMYVREPTQVSVGSDDGAAALSGIAIVDEGGHNWLTHRYGGDAVTALLAPGKYRVLFHPAPVGPGATAKTQLAYLKLADTPTQAQRRASRDLQSTLPGAPTGEAAFMKHQALGLATANSCIACSFDGANLEAHDFTGQDLEQSTFRGANLTLAHFSDANCKHCVFTGMHILNTTYAGFDRTNLGYATLQGVFVNVLFRGADMEFATVNESEFYSCDFGPSPDGVTTSLRNADLSQAYFQTFGPNGALHGADFTGAKGQPGMFTRNGANTMMIGAKFANMTPANLFAGYDFSGMDLTGVDFTGMDLSHVNLSKTIGVTISVTTTNFWDAILTDGTSGVDLSGQDFGTQFSKFAGSFDGTKIGKDLRGVNFTRANLYQANLTGTNLNGAVLVGADLTESSLYHATLQGAQLGVTPDDPTAVAANLTGAYMTGADLTDADLRSVKFDNAHVYGGVKFLRARADSASMNATNLADADFTQASLSDTDFTNAVLVNATFSAANLINADLYGANLYGASFVNTQSVKGANLANAYISTAAGAWPFSEKGTPYVYGYGATLLGDIASSAKGVVTCPDGERGPCTGAQLLPPPSVPYPPPPPDDCMDPDNPACLPPVPPQH